MDQNYEDVMSFVSDVTGEGLSECCGAKVYAPTDSWAQCMDCKEFCGVIKDGKNIDEIAQEKGEQASDQDRGN